MAASEPNTQPVEPWLQGATRVTRGAQIASQNPEIGLEKAGAGEFSLNEFKRGLAGLLGLPLDTMSNVVNLAIASYGTAKGAVGGTELPELRPPPLGGHKTFENILDVQQLQPESKAGQFAGDVSRVIGSSAVPAMGFASISARPLASLAQQGALAALAGSGGAIGKEVVPERFAGSGEIAGQILGGVVIPARVASITEGARNLAKHGAEGARGILDPYAERIVRERMIEATRQFPAAERNLAEAAAIEKVIPGLQFRAGQASGVPSIMTMEENLARSSATQLNARITQEQAQRAAIEARAQQRLPLLAKTPEKELAALRSQQQGLTTRLPETISQQEAGQTLRGARTTAKAAFDREASRRFGEATQEAEKLGVKVNASEIYESAQQLKSNPLLAFDESNLPSVVRRIDASKKILEDKTPQLLGPTGQPLRARETQQPAEIDFGDLVAMRTAVNQDLAREAGSGSSNARQRLRALVEMRQSIDKAVSQTPATVKNAYEKASQWYRDVYAPKFLRGVNLKQSLSDITGEKKILDEKLVAAYFKPAGATSMKRFVDLYQENPRAMSVMQDSILNRYSSEVIKDGLIDPTRHQIFMSKYGEALDKVPAVSRQIASIGNAARTLGAREEQFSNLQGIVSKGQLAALRNDNPDIPGLDSTKVARFVRLHEADLKSSIAAIYGEKTANEHIANLKEIGKAAQIADRGYLGSQAAAGMETLPTLSGRTGFTFRTVMSLYRAIVTGRTSPQDMGTVLGTQYAGNVITKALRAAEERAISDPDTAKLLMRAQSTPITGTEGKKLILQILAKGGAYWAGLPKMKQYGELRLPSLAVEVGETQ